MGKPQSPFKNFLAQLLRERGIRGMRGLADELQEHGYIYWAEDCRLYADNAVAVDRPEFPGRTMWFNAVVETLDLSRTETENLVCLMVVGSAPHPLDAKQGERLIGWKLAKLA